MLNAGVRNGLNPAEIAILKTMTLGQIVHFGLIFQNVKNYGYDLISSNGLFPGTPPDEGYANAFVHLSLSFKFKEAFGTNLAIQLLNAHESTQDPTNIQSIMDQRNNQIGLSLSNLSNEIMLNYATSGALWTIQVINGTRTLGQFQYYPSDNPPRWTPQP